MPHTTSFPTLFSRDELTNIVNGAIDRMAYPAQPDGLYAPIRYALGTGGKRLRPALMLLSYNLYRDNVDSILPQAIALETYHNFTLLHDDLMDRAQVRRGNPCVHVRWNDNTAILSGDTMLILAYRLFTENQAVTPAALVTFNEATQGVCEGQQYDMEFETRQDVSETEYMEMIRLKTSLLLACALKIGAQLAQAPTADADALYEFGERMGQAFQLQDDLLDVYGDPAVFGKKIGGDILCNKKTFMLIRTLALADESQRQQMLQWISATDYCPEEKIHAVRAIYDAVGIRSVAEERINALFAESLNALNRVGVSDGRKEELRRFAHWLMGRAY